MDAFWEAMGNDLKTMRYDSYEQLQSYMYGSAEVVGLVMCDLIGYDAEHREETLAGARKLGEAMQLTNFLRDVAEDWNELGRIYMPSDDLSRF
jgi:15-cis-phytoene synthase